MFGKMKSLLAKIDDLNYRLAEVEQIILNDRVAKAQAKEQSKTKTIKTSDHSGEPIKPTKKDGTNAIKSE